MSSPLRSSQRARFGEHGILIALPVSLAIWGIVALLTHAI